MKFLVSLLVLFCCFAFSNSYAAEITGSVISVADGDTFTLLTADKQEIKIRLAEIDAPESGQPYGNRSKQVLTRILHGKTVEVIIETTDRYGRTVGRPFVDGVDVCKEMVRLGAAWVYRDYVVDDTLFDVEAEARQAKNGLWGISESTSTPPWEWRRSGGQNPDGCDIKGNINSKGARIYHVPGTSSYGATRINEAKGERWFCSEPEARSAGWRPPLN